MKAIMSLYRWWFAIPMSTRWAIGIWMLLLCGVFGRVSFSDKHSVIPIYEAAGERWAAGDRLYQEFKHMDVFRNPPGFAAAFSLVRNVPDKLVAIGWRALGIGLFLWGLLNWWTVVDDSGSHWRQAIYLIFAAVIILPAFDNGQSNVHVVATALLGLAALAKGSLWRAAAWLSLCVAIKVYPVAIAGLAAVVAPRRLILPLLIFLAILASIPCLMQDPQYVLDRTREFVSSTTLDDRSTAPLYRTPRDWTFLVRITSGEIMSRDVTIPVSAGAGILMAAIVALGTGTREKCIKALALGLIWITLFGPATEANTYSCLAPLAWLAVVPAHRPRWAIACGWIATCFLTLAVIRGAFPINLGYPLWELQPLAAILYIVPILAPTYSQLPQGGDRVRSDLG